MKKIEKILTDSINELEDIDSKPYSKQGFEQFKMQITKFIILLYQESFRNSKKESLENITDKNVLDAANYLTKINKFKFKDFLNTLGGILVGLTMSFLFSMLTLNVQYNSGIIISYIIIGLAGAFMLGFNISRE